MPDQSSSFLDQQIAAAKEQMAKEMPDVAGTSIQPMGPVGSLASGALDKLNHGTTMAFTQPTGSIVYNPAALQGQPQSAIEDLLAHELTHTRQYQSKPWLSRIADVAKSFVTPGVPYGQNPNELEAFQTETNRAQAQGRNPSPMPNFLTPGFRESGDIQLPSPLQAQLLKRANQR
jgi:hypothetical protein